LRVFLSTADASGDMHAAGLVAALRESLQERSQSLEVFGLGGPALEAEGFRTVVAQSDLAVAGLFEVLAEAPRMLGGYRKLRRALTADPPDLAIFVDTPDLNLPLCRVAKASGVPVFYYVAPQVWAWRMGRVNKLRRRVDHVGAIFPFEESLLREAGVPATFVGHPLVEPMCELRARLNRAVVAADLSIDLDRPLFGLLPGSRRNEVTKNLPVMLETARLLRQCVPRVQILLLLAPTLEGPSLEIPEFVRVVRGNTHQAIAISTAVLAAPGTVTVEAALLGTPMLIAHRANPFSFEIARRISRVPSSCMVNLIADRGIVSERLQEMARPAALAAEASRLLGDAAAREQMCKSLEDVTARLGGPGAARRAAALALEVAGNS